MDHKSGYLVILCCALIHMTTLGSDMIFYHTADQDATTCASHLVKFSYSLSPLSSASKDGLADVYFTYFDCELCEA